MIESRESETPHRSQKKSSNERESADKGLLFALCVVVHCASSQHSCEREREKIVAGWKSSSWDRFLQQSSVSTERCDCYHTNVERVSRLLNFNQFFTSRLVYEWKFVFFLILIVSSSCRKNLEKDLLWRKAEKNRDEGIFCDFLSLVTVTVEMKWNTK